MKEKLEEHARVVLLDVERITPSPYQARKTFLSLIHIFAFAGGLWAMQASGRFLLPPVVVQ